MRKKIKDDQWVWVVVQDPEGNEQFLGQRDETKDISFIPTFLEKDAALQCMNHLALKRGHKYEVQAILYEDLVPKAAEQGFCLLVLNESGEVLEQIDPFSVRGLLFTSPPERCHELTEGKRSGKLSVDLDHPYRLIFIPDNDPVPRRDDGGLNWSQVTAIKIIGVEDTHG